MLRCARIPPAERYHDFQRTPHLCVPDTTANISPRPLRDTPAVPEPQFVYLWVAAKDKNSPLYRVKQVLQAHPGPTRVRIKLEPEGRWIEVHEHLRVTVTPSLVNALARIVGEESVVVK